MINSVIKIFHIVGYVVLYAILYLLRALGIGVPGPFKRGLK